MTNHQDTRALPPRRSQTLDWIQQVIATALQLEHSSAMPMRVGPSLKLDTAELRKTICEDALGFLAELTLEEDHVPSNVMLDRLNPYLCCPITDLDYEFFQYPEAVYGLCCILLVYEKAHSDFYDYFSDDEEIAMELAMAGSAITSLLRFLNNGRLPNLKGLNNATSGLGTRFVQQSPVTD